MDNLYDENINEEVVDTDSGEEVTEQLFDEEESFFGGGDNTYVKKSDKYEDIRSSAFTMLIVGMLGVIFVILSLTKVINIPFSETTAWLFYTIMSAVFVAFVIAGIVSLVKANKLKEEAVVEDAKIDEINIWAKDNLRTDAIDLGLDLNETVEILYFSRAEKIKSILMHQFEDVDEGLIDLLTENIYQRLYEDDEAFDEEYDYDYEEVEKTDSTSEE